MKLCACLVFMVTENVLAFCVWSWKIPVKSGAEITLLWKALLGQMGTAFFSQ